MIPTHQSSCRINVAFFHFYHLILTIIYLPSSGCPGQPCHPLLVLHALWWTIPGELLVCWTTWAVSQFKVHIKVAPNHALRMSNAFVGSLIRQPLCAIRTKSFQHLWVPAQVKRLVLFAPFLHKNSHLLNLRHLSCPGLLIRDPPPPSRTSIHIVHVYFSKRKKKTVSRNSPTHKLITDKSWTGSFGKALR